MPKENDHGNSNTSFALNFIAEKMCGIILRAKARSHKRPEFSPNGSNKNAKPVSNSGITRRRFLPLFFGWLGVGAVASEFGPGAVRWLMDVPPASPERQIPNPYPGWLETSLPARPLLISPKEGHKLYLRYLCLTHPVLRDALAQAYGRIFQEETNLGPPRLGDCLQNHLLFVRNSLCKVMGDTSPSLTNTVHLATMTMAAVLSPYFSVQEIENLGVAIPSKVSPEDKVLLIPEYDKAVPKVFPADPSSCRSKIDTIARCQGGDRAVHFAQHLFLTHQVYYALTHKLQDINRIPNAAKLSMLLGNSPENQTKIVDWLAQITWESLETIEYFGEGQGEYGRDEYGHQIPSGFTDEFVDRDLWANTLGLRAGLKLSQNPTTWGTLNEVINSLNNPAYYTVT